MSVSLGSLRVFVCNYVLYSFGLIFRYIFRFLHNLGDAKKEVIDPPPPPTQADGAKWNRFGDSEIDGFPEELANFLFWSEDFHGGSEEREGETEFSVFMDPVVLGESEKIDGKAECSALKETVKTEVNRESPVSEEIESDIFEDCIDREKEDGSVSMQSDSANLVVNEDGKENGGGETEGFVSMEIGSYVHEDEKKINEDKTESSVFMENGPDLHHDDMKEEKEEIGGATIVENENDVHEEEGRNIGGNETENSVLLKNASSVNEDHKKIDENETESSVFRDDGFELYHNSKREEEEREGPVFAETDTVTTTSKFQYLSEKDISGFIEEPTTLRFSFREFIMSPDVSAISDKEFSELDSEKEDTVAEEEREGSLQEKVSVHSTDNNNINVPFRFESEAFGGTDSSSDDEDCYLFNENSVTSDSESESSSSSGLIWGNSNINNIDDDDLVGFQFLGGGKNVGERFESEILKLMMRDEKRTEGVVEKQCSKVSEFEVHDICYENGYIEMEPGMKGLRFLKDQKEGSHHHEEMAWRKTEEATRWEEELGESESDDDDDFEWEHDDLVEQLKLELRNSRQGGLATILEEEEEEGEEKTEETESPKMEETESPKVVEDLRPLKIEEKLEYKDQIDEIERVYKIYAEKMKKLDILNYQTMHALGLLQLKDPLKLISTPGAKPVVISQNLWPRKATKITSDPLLKLVHELHRDLELVYVGQICLSWEILCWQHKKALELQQYDSQGSHRYNLVAGEFQLLQVLLQRFIENEPFQGSPRIQNYVKNRCVIRNLLQVPPIKDDDSKGGEEDAIGSGKLGEIIKESMRVFWEFVRADKDYGNVILKASKQIIGTDLKDPAIPGLLVDIRTQLHKKERKLKDIVRSGNCIVRKFQKQHHEDPLDHEQLVAQVGLRLISRVLNMSRLSKEQLLWCNEKLHRVKFLSRKIVHVEPSFLLFPC